MSQKGQSAPSAAGVCHPAAVNSNVHKGDIMRRFILPIAAVLLTAACHSGNATPTGSSSDSTGKPAASPSASAPKTADGPMVTWCHEHPLSDLCTSGGSPEPRLSMPPSPVFSSAMAQVWKQLCEEKNPAPVCEATPSR